MKTRVKTDNALTKRLLIISIFEELDEAWAIETSKWREMVNETKKVDIAGMNWNTPYFRSTWSKATLSALPLKMLWLAIEVRERT